MSRREELSTEEVGRMREAITRVMEARQLRAHPWAEAAGVSSGSLYAFLKGRTNHLSTPLLRKLADAAGVPVSALTGEDPTPDTLEITHTIRGDEAQPAKRRTRIAAPVLPDGTARGLGVAEILAGIGGALREGGLVYWRTDPPLPMEAANGRLCMCAVEGRENLVLAEVRGGFGAGAHVLLTAAGRVLDNVALTAAYPVIWVRLPPP